MIRFLDAAFDWAERKDVPIAAVRDAYGDWAVRLQFSDANGAFFAVVPAFEIERKRGEAEADSGRRFQTRIEKTLSDTCVAVRRKRLVALNGCDPRSQAA